MLPLKGLKSKFFFIFIVLVLLLIILESCRKKNKNEKNKNLKIDFVIDDFVATDFIRYDSLLILVGSNKSQEIIFAFFNIDNNSTELYSWEKERIYEFPIKIYRFNQKNTSLVVFDGELHTLDLSNKKIEELITFRGDIIDIHVNNNMYILLNENYLLGPPTKVTVNPIGLLCSIENQSQNSQKSISFLPKPPTILLTSYTTYKGKPMVLSFVKNDHRYSWYYTITKLDYDKLNYLESEYGVTLHDADKLRYPLKLINVDNQFLVVLEKVKIPNASDIETYLTFFEGTNFNFSKSLLISNNQNDSITDATWYKNHFYVVGYNSQKETFIMKLSKDGKILWKKNLQGLHAPGKIKILKTEKNFIFLSSVLSDNQSEEDHPNWLAKIDLNGRTVFSKKFFPNTLSISDIAEESNYLKILAIEKDLFTNRSFMVLYKVTSNGEIAQKINLQDSTKKRGLIPAFGKFIDDDEHPSILIGGNVKIDDKMVLSLLKLSEKDLYPHYYYSYLSSGNADFHPYTSLVINDIISVAGMIYHKILGTYLPIYVEINSKDGTLKNAIIPHSEYIPTLLHATIMNDNNILTLSNRKFLNQPLYYISKLNLQNLKASHFMLPVDSLVPKTIHFFKNNCVVAGHTMNENKLFIRLISQNGNILKTNITDYVMIPNCELFISSDTNNLYVGITSAPSSSTFSLHPVLLKINNALEIIGELMITKDDHLLLTGMKTLSNDHLLVIFSPISDYYVEKLTNKQHIDMWYFLNINTSVHSGKTFVRSVSSNDFKSIN